MRISKRILLIFLGIILMTPAYAQIGMQELGDSLFAYTGFSRVWSPAVRVKNLRVNGNKVSLYTNGTLRDVRWTPASVADIKRKVSLWTLGHENGRVTIYSNKTDIETLITACAKGSTSAPKEKDLTDRTVVVYPSHGLYFNRERDEWIWQRATLWTTVEDLYSQEYVRLIKQMLENAGATVLSPRAGLDEQELGVSGMPKWTEGARYWLAGQGEDSTLWDLYQGNEYKDDMKCRGMWVNSLENAPDLCLALHTDGLDSGNDSIIAGTLVIYTARDDEGNTVLRDGRDREKVNRNLADWIQTTVTEDLTHWAPEWTRRQLKEANYCETRVPVVPSIILELLSHKNMADMRYGLNPAFRFAAARAVYKGILKYLNGPNAIVQPLPVKQVALHPDGLLQWAPATDTLEQSAAPTYYMIYTRANDGEWDVQQVENATQLKLTLEHGVLYSCYIVAGNEGGLSMRSPIVSAYLSDRDETTMALVVDGFDEVYGPEWFADSTFAGIVPGTYACEDEFSCAYIGQQWNYNRADEWKNDDNCGWGSCYRDHAGQLTIGNTRDYAFQHGRELRKMHISYGSCTAAFLEDCLRDTTSHFTMIDYVCGRNRQPLNTLTQVLLSGYLAQGGRLLMSTDHFSAIDPAWAKTQFHATYYAAQATRSGRVSTPRHRMYHLYLEPNPDQLFTAHPEALQATDTEAVKMATYEDMRCTAAIGRPGRTLVYAFPLEAVMDFDKIYRHSVEWLLDRRR